MRVRTLGSGSSGNCTLFRAGGSALLVDAGISQEKIEAALETEDLAPGDLAGIVITHVHGDHLGCAAKFSRRHKINLYASEPAVRSNGVVGRVKRLVRYAPGGEFDAGVFHIFTIPLFHDSPGTVGCVVAHGNIQFGVVTDLGRATSGVAEALARCDGFLLEFNHDEIALRDGIYPWRLKRRVLSEEGHLSNDQAAALLLKCLSLKTREVVLAHLSEKNNSPEAALESARRIIQLSGASARVHAAPRAEPGPPIELA